MNRLCRILIGVVLSSMPAAGQVADSTGSLAPFFAKLEAVRTSGEGVVTVLHIGDSHVQAGVWTGRMRELLQRDFGNAGRGLIVPHKLAGMNEARDYAITTGYAHHTHKAGPTMVEVSFDVPFNEFRLWSKEPFDCVTVLHGMRAPALSEPAIFSIGSWCDLADTDISMRIPLDHETDTLVLSGFVHGVFNDPTYYGFVLENGRAGVLYHAAGLNGAAFEAFAGVARGSLAMLKPDLVIISLGTNNCFGPNFAEAQLYNVVDGFVRDVKEHYPGAAVLLTTPMEACRCAGSRYNPNPNIGAAARIIRSVAVDNGVASWDFYEAAGGKGAMEVWHTGGLANRDRIHLTEKGYLRQGDMMYEDLMKWQCSNK
jgi:lysophospholipase L1-like esterase